MFHFPFDFSLEQGDVIVAIFNFGHYMGESVTMIELFINKPIGGIFHIN